MFGFSEQGREPSGTGKSPVEWADTVLWQRVGLNQKKIEGVELAFSTGGL